MSKVVLSKESFAHTVKNFWTKKRLLKLFLFALLLANVSMYCVGKIAEKQVLKSAVSMHEKIYTAFMQAVEAAKAGSVKSSKPVSPYWVALADIRKQFPFQKMNITMSGNIEIEHDRKVLELLKNRPHGWVFNEEYDGWARSFFILPTSNTAAVQVVTYVKDDLAAWEATSVLIGAYAFVLLFAFGWFWTRALHEAGVEKNESPEIDEVVLQKIKALEQISSEIEAVIMEVQKNIEQPLLQNFASLEELLSQIRLLAVNGSIEAARSADTYRVFHVIMQEINQIALQAKDLMSSAHSSLSSEKIQEVQNLIRQCGVSTSSEAEDAPSGRAANKR